MKKMLSLMLVLVMICGLATSAFAIDSKTDPVTPSATDPATGRPVNVRVSDTSTSITTEQATAIVEDVIAEAFPNEEAESVEVLWTKDVKSEVLPVDITFDAPGTEGMELVVLHFNGTSWDVVAHGTGPSVTATFTELSPVGLVATKLASKETKPSTKPAETPAETPADTSAAAPADTGDKSPKTGADMTPVAICGIFVMFAVAVSVIYRKKVA